jgi:hypothetical protein
MSSKPYRDFSAHFASSHWKWPDIKGLHDFTGTICHSARYDPNTVLEGKRVAVIGVGGRWNSRDCKYCIQG